MRTAADRLALALARISSGGRGGAFLALLAGWAFPPLVLSAETPALPEPKPNVIYILADDGGYGDFGPYGQTRIATPSLDRMAREGMLFMNHYAGAPVSAPSRCSLLTGMHTGHALVRGNVEIMPEGQSPLPEGTVTAGTVAKEAGAETAVIGKWGLGGPGSSGEPGKQGFDRSFGYLCQRQAHSYYPDHLWEDGKRLELDGKTYSHDLFTEKALAFLRERAGGSFFLYMAYTIPHAALQVPELGEYADRDWPEPQKRYAAMITRLDRDVGRILDEVDRLGIAGRTLVILSSDNGPAAEGGAAPAFFDSAAGLRGKKREVYEGGIRTPFVARWPGKVPAGAKVDFPVAAWDFLPTLAEIYDRPAPAGIDGISMLPLLLGRGPGEAMAKRPYLYWEFHELGGSQALRFGDWKAVRRDLRLFPNNRRIELYDLAADRGETRDLAASRPDLVAQAAAYFKEAHVESRTFPLLGRNPLVFQSWNAWLALAGGAGAALLALLLRLAAGRGLPGPKGLDLVAAATCLPLAALSLFLGLWLDTGFFYAGAGLCGLGLLGALAASIADSFGGRKTGEGKALTGGAAGTAMLVGAELFWLGIGVATVSRLFLLVWLAGLPLRILALLRRRGRAGTPRRASPS